MSTTTGKGSRGDETDVARRRKAQILDAAAECFRQKGFHRSSLAQIAATAGMSVGHIYHYFKSKEDIVAAIVESEQGEARPLIEAARAAEDVPDVINVFIDQLAQAVAHHQDTSRASLKMEILAEASRNPEIGRIVQQKHDEFRQVLVALFKDAPSGLQSRLEIIGALLQGLSMRSLSNSKADNSLDFDMLRNVVRYVLTSQDGFHPTKPIEEECKGK